MKLWVDVEDLFDYAQRVKRPSGIQRVAFELQRALVEIAPESVQFVRHGKQSGCFVTVPFARIEALFEDFSADIPEAREVPEKEPAPVAVAPLEVSLYRRLRRRGRAILPQALHTPAIKLWLRSAETAGAAGVLLKAIFTPETWRAPEKLLPPPVTNVKPLPERERSIATAAGDWLVALGSPWACPDHAARVAQFCESHGLRFAMLIYDIIPIRRPEWVYQDTRGAFHDWLQAIVPRCDALFAISHATAQDVEHYAAETALPLPGRVHTLPMGTGFSDMAAPVRTRRLPPRRSYALIVSTIEIRKNHLLLFRIWRELTEQMPWDEIPTLVFAGRVGWMVADLMQMLKNTCWLNGKIQLIEAPTDAELAALYEGCMFSLYPSFYEGWGLPVTESHAYGAPCIASNRTSLTEAGGDLALYFDPDNLAEAVRVVRQVIENPAALQSWRERVARDFKPVAWAEPARALLAQLQRAGSLPAPQLLPTAAAAE